MYGIHVISDLVEPRDGGGGDDGGGEERERQRIEATGCAIGREAGSHMAMQPWCAPAGAGVKRRASPARNRRNRRNRRRHRRRRRRGQLRRVSARAARARATRR